MPTDAPAADAVSARVNDLGKADRGPGGRLDARHTSRTSASTAAGTGARSATLAPVADRPRTDTSEPPDSVVCSSSTLERIVSVSTMVPARNAMPRATALALSNSRSLCAAMPRRVMASISGSTPSTRAKVAATSRWPAVLGWKPSALVNRVRSRPRARSTRTAPSASDHAGDGRVVASSTTAHGSRRAAARTATRRPRRSPAHPVGRRGRRASCRLAGMLPTSRLGAAAATELAQQVCSCCFVRRAPGPGGSGR